MAFGELNISKTIALNSPKYQTIIEPFADNGAFALYLKKKRPKKHIINYENEDLFKIMLMIQSMSSSDFNNLKARDWVGNQITFDSVVGISAVDGLDFFYRFFYLRHFSERQIDKEAPPMFDILKMCKDVKNFMFDLKLTKVGLKNVEILNQESVSAMSLGGAEPFYILVPKGEQIEAVDSRLNSISGNYFYSKKSKSNELLLESAISNPDKFVAPLTVSTIMGGTNQITTNYETRIPILDVELIESGNCGN